MGLFSTKKKIYVASVAYNLAGDITDRIQVLRSTVSNAALLGDPKTPMTDHILGSQLDGPGMSQQSFFRWSTTHYAKGTVIGNINQQSEVDPALVLPHLSVPGGKVAFITSTFIDSADMGYWAERHILLNQPAKFDTDWTCDLIGNVLTIQYADLTTENITLTDLDRSADYVYAYYNQRNAGTAGSTTTGPMTVDAVAKPSTTGYTQKYYSGPVVPVTLTKVVTTTVDDGVNPPDVSTSTTTSTQNFTDAEERWERQAFVAEDPTNQRTVYNRYTRYIWADYTVQVQTTTSSSTTGGVTTTIQTDQDILVPNWDWREDTTVIYSSDLYEEARLFIYKLGGAIPGLNALKALQTTSTEFFPVIPVRLDNKSIRHGDFSADIETYRKAYKKATKGKLDELVDLVEDNEKLGDIDYAYVWHGVELNSKDRAGLRYLYEFFRELMFYQKASKADWTNWVSRITNYAAIEAQQEIWSAAQANPADPLYGTARPSEDTRPMAPMTSLRVHSTQLPSVDFRLTWATIDESLHAGEGKPGAKVGELWFQVLPDVAVPVIGVTRQGDETVERVLWNANGHTAFKLYHQTSATSYRVLEVIGMAHQNYVYGGKAVTITAREALEDPDETGFLVPLHYPTLKKLPLAISTQLSVSNRLILFNCYKVVKIKWYQRGIFRVIIAVVIAVVIAVFAPAGIGLLGTHLAVGTALGLTGMTAVLVGAAVNAVAAMLLSAIVQRAAVAVLGEKWGAILGTVLTALAFNYVSGFINGTGFSIDWGSMMRVDNLMKLTDSVTGMITGWARGEIGEIQGDLVKAETGYQKQMKEIQKKTEEILGYGNGVIDPLLFTEISGISDFQSEPMDRFLQRTLMTGTDVAELSFSMISDYVELNLELPDPIA